MNICMMNTASSWGGGEKWHLEMSVGLHKKGHKTFLVTNKKSVLFRKAVNHNLTSYNIRITNFSFLNPYKLYLLYRFFKKNKVQSIIFNLPNDLKIGGIAARLAGVEKIIYRRGSAIPVSNSISNRILFRKIVNRIIANSEETKNTILQNNRKLISPQRIKVIYNGLEFPEFKQRSAKVKRDIVFGNMGRMVQQKGQDILIEIAVYLQKRLPYFQIVVAGEGPLKSSLIKLAKQKGVGSNFEFVGFIEDTWGFMQRIDIFLLPSRWEGFGYVLVEAMACGKPVVAFNVSSNPELVRNNYNGFLSEPDDIRDFADKAYKLAADPGLVAKMGSNGKTFAEQNFRLSKKVDEVENFLAS